MIGSPAALLAALTVFVLTPLADQLLTPATAGSRSASWST